ncbi:MAG: LacI family transcriptional regulator [Desulfovibrio sp.]|jgi:hypothetical protein|nr:LacI family transcriptional regulator [Desulfovibrio sp.]
MDWIEILTAAVKAGSRAEAARRLGVSRTAISLIMSGKYPGDMRRMAARVLAAYGQGERLCKALDRFVTDEECTANGGRIPTSSPAALRLWRECRKCPLRPEKQQ